MPKIGTRSGENTNCSECGKSIYLFPSQVKRGYKCCSQKCRSVAISGEKNPHFGQQHTEETKKQISDKKTGTKLSEERKKQISIHSRLHARYGAANPWWKGGIASERNRLGNSLEWKDWRKAVFSRDCYTCRRCGAKNKKFNPHHIENFAEVIEKRFLVDNGITLCEPCHREFHSMYGKKKNNQEQINQFVS